MGSGTGRAQELSSGVQFYKSNNPNLSMTEDHPQLSTSTPDQMNTLVKEQYDWAATYSSIEHDGLGHTLTLLLALILNLT